MGEPTPEEIDQMRTEPVGWTCHVCDELFFGGMEGAAKHMEEAHGYEFVCSCGTRVQNFQTVDAVIRFAEFHRESHERQETV